MKQNDLLQKLKEHQPITINYGKGTLSNEDIKDYAVWDETIQRYRDDTGIWDTELLIDIANGKSKNAKIEE